MKIKYFKDYKYRNKTFKVFKSEEGIEYLAKDTELNNYQILLEINEISKECDHILGISAFYKKDDRLYYFLEFIEGVTLEEVILNSKKLSKEEINSIILQVSFALKSLHDNSIVHADIKPANIIIGKDNIVRLIDFDISRYYYEKKNSGTQGYAAPEHYGFGKIDNRSDIYSLGIVINTLVSSCATDIKSDYDLIINKCIEIDINNRYESIDEIIKLIENNYYTLLQSQKDQINDAKEKGLSEDKIKIINNPLYNSKQMGVIKHACLEKMDRQVLKLMLDKDLNSRQMWQIKKGYDESLSYNEIATYAKPIYSNVEMGIYRNGLILKKSKEEIKNQIEAYNIYVYSNYLNEDQLYKLRYKAYNYENI